MAEKTHPTKEAIEAMVSSVKTPEEAVEFVAKNEAFLKAPIDDLETIFLFRAARAGNFNLVKAIAAKLPEQLHFHKEGNGADVLQHAVVSGNLDMVKWLLSMKCDPNYKYFAGTSLLYYAIEYKHMHLIRFMIEELKFKHDELLTESGAQALYLALQKQDKEMFKYFLSMKPVLVEKGNRNYLGMAAKTDDLFYLDELLNYGAPFSIMDPYLRSAFSWSGEDNRHKAMELILRKAKGVHSEDLLAPGISAISHEYNMMCYKWWRQYDIYMVRYYCELVRKEVEPKPGVESFMAMPQLAAVMDIINKPGKIESLLFKLPRNIFRNILKYTELVPHVVQSKD